MITQPRANSEFQHLNHQSESAERQYRNQSIIFRDKRTREIPLLLGVVYNADLWNVLREIHSVFLVVFASGDV